MVMGLNINFFIFPEWFEGENHLKHKIKNKSILDFDLVKIYYVLFLN